MVFIVTFIAAHGVGQGTVIWVYISEIFPNQVWDYGMSLGAGTHWVCAAVITLLTPAVLNAYSGGAIFALFRRYDGAAVAFCSIYDAGNQEQIFRGIGRRALSERA